MYEFISRHFLATISRDARFQKKIVKISVGSHQFGLKGTTLTDPGFTEILPWVKIFDHYIPDFQEGQEFPLAQVDIHIGKVP
jgi:DNA topoisomerase-3